MKPRKIKDISLAERRKILARIAGFGKRAGRKRADVKGLQQHSLAVNRFARAVAAELIKRGAELDYKKISRASLMHDMARQRSLVSVDFIKGKTRPSKLLGSEERTNHGYLEEVDEKIARKLLSRSKNPEEREAAKLLTGNKWMRYNNAEARTHITLEQLIVDLGDSVVEGKRFVTVEKRLETLLGRMGSYSDTEKIRFKRAFGRMQKMAVKKIQRRYGVSIDAVIKRLQKRRW